MVKLKIQLLPCVLSFVDGIVVDRIVGFEGLAHSPDSFTTRDLEARLLTSGVLVRAKTEVAEGLRSGRRGIFGREDPAKEDSDNDDE